VFNQQYCPLSLILSSTAFVNPHPPLYAEQLGMPQRRLPAFESPRLNFATGVVTVGVEQRSRGIQLASCCLECTR